MKVLIISLYLVAVVTVGMLLGNVITYMKTGGKPVYIEYKCKNDLSVKEAQLLLEGSYKSDNDYSEKFTVGEHYKPRLFRSAEIVSVDTLEYGIYH